MFSITTKTSHITSEPGYVSIITKLAPMITYEHTNDMKQLSS